MSAGVLQHGVLRCSKATWMTLHDRRIQILQILQTCKRSPAQMVKECRVKECTVQAAGAARATNLGLWLVQDVHCRMLHWTVTDTAVSPSQGFMLYSSITPVVHMVGCSFAPVQDPLQTCGALEESHVQLSWHPLANIL